MPSRTVSLSQGVWTKITNGGEKALLQLRSRTPVRVFIGIAPPADASDPAGDHCFFLDAGVFEMIDTSLPDGEDMFAYAVLADAKVTVLEQ